MQGHPPAHPGPSAAPDRPLTRSAVLGLPAMGREDGRPAGAVADVLFNGRGDRVVGLLLAGGTWWRRRLIPFEEVAAIGTAAVLLRRPVVLSGPKGGVRRLRRAQAAFIGMRVLSEHGHDLGVIDDVCFLPDDGRVTGFLVSTGVVGDALEGKRFLPAAAVAARGRPAEVRRVAAAMGAQAPRGDPEHPGPGPADPGPPAVLLTAPWPSRRQ